MKKIYYFLQILLKLTLIFFLSFIWLRFFLDSLWLSAVIALSITILIECLHRLIKKHNKNKSSLKIKEKEDADNIFFSLLTDNKYMKFYEEMLKSRHNQVSVKKQYLLIKKNDITILLFPYLKLKTLTADDLLDILKSSKDKFDKIIILCHDYNKETEVFKKNFNKEILLLDKYETYTLYKEYDYFPEITNEYKKEAKLTFKDMLSFAFNRSRSKGYILSAIFLFITSFFVQMNVYYCIISSLLLIMALISYINPKYNKKVSKEVI